MITLELVGTLQEAVTSGALLVAFPIAVIAGLVSFASPCVLPLVPGYLSFITGLTGAELAGTEPEQPVGKPSGASGSDPSSESVVTQDASNQEASSQELSARPIPRTGFAKYSRVVLGTGLFVLGFSIVFVAFGFLFGAASEWFFGNVRGIQIALGSLVIVLGLMFGGWIPGLNREYRFHLAPKYGLWGAPLLGVVFGLGWVPCIGPTLSAVLSLAYTEGSAVRGAILAFAYCIGLGIPFLLIGLAFNKAAVTMGWIRRHYQLIMRLGGALLVAIGVMLVTGLWNTLITYLQTWIASYDLPL